MAGVHQALIFAAQSNVLTVNLSVPGPLPSPDYNIKTKAIAAGWNGTDPVNVILTIGATAYIYASELPKNPSYAGQVALIAAHYGLDTGTGYPAGSSVSIINNGVIAGMGGHGGAGFGDTNDPFNLAGGPGSPALNAQVPVTITNNGTIGGGGGGGAVGQAGDDGVDTAAGGGGGGGRPLGSGGVGDNPGSTDDGGGGSLSAPGTGGIVPLPIAGNGGNGGDLGQPGQDSPVGTNPTGGTYTGGSAGAAISGMANITWINMGTILGTTS